MGGFDVCTLKGKYMVEIPHPPLMDHDLRVEPQVKENL